MFEKLMAEAKELGKLVDTEWAEEHEDLYFQFANKIELAWGRDQITDEEFDKLACTAFYDYDGLKCEY